MYCSAQSIMTNDLTDEGVEAILQRGSPASWPDSHSDELKIPFGRHRDNIWIIGDIVSPMPVEWFEGSVDGDEDLFSPLTSG